MNSRRKFISNVSKGAAIGLAAPYLSAFDSIAQDRKLGVALVGMGSYATGQLAPALQQTQNCYLAGFVTGTPSKIPGLKERYNIPDSNIYNYETFDRIADNPAIDIIYVVLPNSMHHQYVLRAAKTGKHIITEKPMGLSVKECQEMIDACKKAGVKLSVGYRMQFEPHHQEAMRIGQQKVLGDVKLVDAAFGFTIGGPQWRLVKSMAGGGAVMDVGIYCIQAARYVTGEEPISITAQEYKTDPEKFKEVDETVTFQLHFPSGAVANCSTSYAVGVNHLMVRALRGSVEIAPAYDYRGIRGSARGRNAPTMEFEAVNQQARQLDAFATCIRENKESSVSGEEGLKDLKVIEALYKSIETGRKVMIS